MHLPDNDRLLFHLVAEGNEQAFNVLAGNLPPPILLNFKI